MYRWHFDSGFVRFPLEQSSARESKAIAGPAGCGREPPGGLPLSLTVRLMLFAYDIWFWFVFSFGTPTKNIFCYSTA